MVDDRDIHRWEDEGGAPAIDGSQCRCTCMPCRNGEHVYCNHDCDNANWQAPAGEAILAKLTTAESSISKRIEEIVADVAAQAVQIERARCLAVVHHERDSWIGYPDEEIMMAPAQRIADGILANG